MNKLAIVYWSGTGNTETMANCIAEGARESGAEQLEESEFEPMFSDLEGSLNGKKIALFGSYGWGDGQWMREWCSRCEAAGANLYDEAGLIANDSPNEEAREACRELGRKLAAW